MQEKFMHTVVNDVLETDEGIKCARNLFETLFPEALESWNLEIINSRELRMKLSEKLKKYVNDSGLFDLIFCLTTGGMRFFYAPPIDTYGNRMAVLPCSTTHRDETNAFKRVLFKELPRIECDKPKILILEGEVSIFGYTERKLHNIKNFINLLSENFGKHPETKTGVAVLSKGHYIYDKGCVARFKTESKLRRSIDFYAHGETDCVTRLSEDLSIMKQKKLGINSVYFLRLQDALSDRNYITGSLPF